MAEMKSAGWSAVTVAAAGLSFLGGYWVAELKDANRGFRQPDRAAALREILEIEPSREKVVVLARFLGDTKAEEAESLRGVLIEDPLRLDELTEILFAEWWASADPAAAFEQRIDPPWENRHPWLRTVLSIWTRNDPRAAAAAVEQLPEDRRAAAVRTLLDNWTQFAGDEPTPLFQLIRTLDVRPRGRALERFLDAMIEQNGVEAAEAFAEAQPDDSMELGGGMKNEVMGRMGVALANRDLELARQWAARHGEGKGRKGYGILLHLAFHWGARDGPAAMEWAMQLEPSDFKHGTIGRAFLSFQRVQREEAAAWLEARQPTPDLRQVFIPYLDHLVAREKPERAIEIAWTAEDVATRDSLLKSVGKSWLRRDPEAAERWIQESDLPPGVADAILEAAATWKPRAS
jgi:hypothetical protein